MISCHQCGETIQEIPKKGNVLFVRHCETKLSKERIIQGSVIDAPLNKNGRRQAYALARRLEKKFGTHFFDLLITSPLIRTSQTAEILVKKLQIKNGEEDARLKEWHVGEFEGQPISRESLLLTFQKDFAPAGGECAKDFESRVFAALWEIQFTLPNMQKNILVVTHALPIIRIVGYVQKVSLEEMEKRPIPRHASAFHIIIKNCKTQERCLLEVPQKRRAR